MTKFAAALFIERRFIPHDGTRLTIATGVVAGQDAQVMLAGSRAAAEAIRSGLVASRRARVAAAAEAAS